LWRLPLHEGISFPSVCQVSVKKRYYKCRFFVIPSYLFTLSSWTILSRLTDLHYNHLLKLSLGTIWTHRVRRRHSSIHSCLFRYQMVWLYAVGDRRKAEPGALDEWWQKKIEVLREKPVPVPLCSPQIPHKLAWYWPWASEIKDRRITAWTAHSFLTSVPDRGEWSAPSPGRFNVGERVCGIQWLGDWASFREVLDVVEKRVPNHHDPTDVQPVA